MEQLVYTRCYPHVELNDGGKIAQKDGFGVFSTSKGLISNPPVSNYSFLFSRLAIPNAAKEAGPVGLINSYDYFEIKEGVYALSFEVARPLGREPRKNGYSHRPGNYIKQCLVGQVRDYPYHWFGADVWTEWKKSENDFYLDLDPNPVPVPLPQTDDIPIGGSLTEENIRQFVADGRTETVKAGIWFLITESMKRPEERRILIIRDIPQNVELWIAAMESAFSPELASQITFTTNKTALNNRVEASLFGSLEVGPQSFQPMGREGKRPYYQIVGIHPDDSFCSMVRPNGSPNYCIIDGKAKKASFTPDNNTNTAYYRSVVQYSADIRDFCTVVLPSIPVRSISDKLPELYDSYQYLLDTNHRSEHWSYRDSFNALTTFIQFGLPQNDTLTEYLLNEFLRIYMRFFEEDRVNHFPLLKKLFELSKKTNRIGDVEKLSLQMLRQAIIQIDKDGDALSETWSAIKSFGLQRSIRTMIQETFSDERVRTSIRKIENASPSSARTLVELLVEASSQEPGGISSIIADKEKYGMLCMSFVCMVDHPDQLRTAMNLIHEPAELMTNVILSVANYLKEYYPERLQIWWPAAVDATGGDIREFCHDLTVSGFANLLDIEQILHAVMLKKRSCSPTYELIFREAAQTLDRAEDSGLSFYNGWIQVSDKRDSNSIIKSILASELSLATEKRLFLCLDSKLSGEDPSRIDRMVIKAMKDWSARIGVPSVNICISEMLDKLGQNRLPGQATQVIQSFGERELPLPELFTKSVSFVKLSEYGAQYDAPQFHTAMMQLFVFPSSNVAKDYADAYVRSVLNAAKGKQMINTMLSLCEAGMGVAAGQQKNLRASYGAHYYPYTTGKVYQGNSANSLFSGKSQGQSFASNESAEEAIDNSYITFLLDALEKALPLYYKPSFQGQVEKMINCKPAVKQKMIEMLQKISDQGGRESGLDKLFGLFRGKS